MITPEISLGSIGTVVALLGVGWGIAVRLSKLEQQVELMWSTFVRDHGLNGHCPKEPAG